MIKILKKGVESKKESIEVFKAVCKHCECIFEFNIDDFRFISQDITKNNDHHAIVKCPHCKHDIIGTKNSFYVRNEIKEIPINKEEKELFTYLLIDSTNEFPVAMIKIHYKEDLLEAINYANKTDHDELSDEELIYKYLDDNNIVYEVIEIEGEEVKF